MSDWADEIALGLKRIGHLGAKPVATALRKAKADGVRMCADLHDRSGVAYDAEFLRREAVKIEKGLASIIQTVTTDQNPKTS